MSKIVAPERFRNETHCALCGARGKLRRSHIIPSFVFKWLKETSGTGYMRFAKNPNIRIQDGLKMKLLCDACEQKFSPWESDFAKNLFYPYVSNSAHRIVYNSWLAKFCVSVTWRVVASYYRRGFKGEYTEKQIAALENAMRSWELFMNDTTTNPGKYEQHILQLFAIQSTSVTDMPQNINRYILRAVEMDFLVGARGSLMVYAKLGPLLLFGFIDPPPHPWTGTKIAVNRGIFGLGKYTLPDNVLNFIKERAKNYAQFSQAISSNQQKIVNTDVMRNIDRFRDSDQFKAILEDYRMFGESAVVYKEK